MHQTIPEETIEPKNMGERAKSENPEDYLLREIQIVERPIGFWGVCFGFCTLALIVIGTVLATAAYLDLKYQLKYNCISKIEEKTELLVPIVEPTLIPILPTGVR